MRTRLIGLAAAAGLAVAAFPAHAASAPKPQITDPAGDANGVNDQGLGLPVPSSATPIDNSGADITSVLFQTTFVTKKVKKKTVKVPSGFTVTLNLSAAPAVQTDFRVSATTAGCGSSGSVRFEYSTSVAQTGGSADCFGLTTNTAYAGVTTAVKGSAITWTVPIKDFPVGTVFSGLNASTRSVFSVPHAPVGLTAPQWDGAASGTTYTVGK
jgi:hypothetical protein